MFSAFDLMAPIERAESIELSKGGCCCNIDRGLRTCKQKSKEKRASVHFFLLLLICELIFYSTKSCCLLLVLLPQFVRLKRKRNSKISPSTGPQPALALQHSPPKKRKNRIGLPVTLHCRCRCWGVREIGLSKTFQVFLN